MRMIALLVAAVALTACNKQPSATAASVTTTTATDAPAPADPPFVGKIWISTTPGHALGTMLIFMPDRTVVMDSCFETYRLTEWGMAGERIRWLEGAFPIEAEVEMPRPNELVLLIVGQDRKNSYVRASVPYTCPDMPR